MRDIFTHRGPDGAGLYSDSHCVLAHRRLSIVDPAGGHQPLSNEDGMVWVTYNGEIYNHADVRPTLEARGHRYHTKSDTETIVHSYEEWGDDCVHRFRGMFAFALWDAPARRLLLARDRLGVKPLYWARAGNRLIFASEIKSILASELIAAEPNESVIPEVLATRSTAGVDTLFRGIFKLLPGHRLVFHAGCVARQAGWPPMSTVGQPGPGPSGAGKTTVLKLIYMDEFLATEIGQVGTQFDGLGHIGIQLGDDGDQNEMRYYNGVTQRELANSLGLEKLGVEKLRPFFTRGHLLDISGLLDGRVMDAGEEVTPQHIADALDRQGMSDDDIAEGDAVFFNTGWGTLWMENNDRYNSGAPGIGLDAAAWLIEKGVCLVGGDTWPVEVVPNPDPSLAFPVHGELIAKNGIFIHENLTFAELIADKKYRFAYIYTATPFKGGTGSDGCPIAVT